MDEDLIRELRRLFLDGATPSYLIRHVADRLGEGDHLPFAVGDYFREAFGVALVRNVISEEDYSPDLRHSHFNRDVVPEILERRAEWMGDPLAESWLERASVAPLAEHVARLTSVPEGLSAVWSQLSDDERSAVLRKSARINRDWEVIKALSLLAERLQQKVVELETRLQEQPVSQSVGRGD